MQRIANFDFGKGVREFKIERKEFRVYFKERMAGDFGSEGF